MDDLNKLLASAMAEVAAANDKGMQLGRKKYTTVAVRVEVFRKVFGMRGRIRTEMLHADAETVVMQAYVEFWQDGSWQAYANGYAEEKRNSSQVNRTSAVENCESSAVGRALANLGLHGGEYASANEVENAIHQQGQPERKPETRPTLVEKGELPVYPAEAFTANLAKWKPALASGDKTPDQIITVVTTKYRLTDAQRAAIKACASEGANHARA